MLLTKPLTSILDAEVRGGTIALILARGGSKGIPGKNIKLLNGKPLIAYTIEAAKKSKCVDEVFVTTDDNAIAEIAQKYGARILTRPGCLAQEDSQSSEVFLFALRQLRHEQNVHPETLVLLQPTSPFRTGEHIDRAMELFIKQNADGCIMSGCVDRKFHYYYDEEEESYIPILHDPLHRLGRQDIPGDVWPVQENGALYIVSAEAFSLWRDYHLRPIGMYLMDSALSVDLDTMDDWNYAEWLVKPNG